MPYIKQDKRDALERVISVLNGIFHRDVGLSEKGFTGNLNYILYRIAKEHCHKYADFAAFIGELEAAKLEIYRKLVAPYEEKKEEENGSI